LVALERLDDEHGAPARQRLARALQHLQLHALDVNLDEVEPRPGNRVQTDAGDLDRGRRRIINRLANELVVGVRAQFQAAKAPRMQVVGHGQALRATGAAHGGVAGAGVEAVVERQVAGQGVVDPLLRLKRGDRAPTGHGARPLHRMHADVCTPMLAPRSAATTPGPRKILARSSMASATPTSWGSQEPVSSRLKPCRCRTARRACASRSG